ncbi:DUF4279 domain-containing protein [Frondihabitans australicus]|uniref:Uncharacterized protein DUF4279 n=1 Tax=Frondihabitans australicus TaxID=386892 RepID=A0A495IAU1_9MICO|nr:DUF4279 domain-containing protein [Frondihabitans australicus]RKR73124.1 uncharacterized protein DUF4279 [Frondihabitans australicus]
MSDDDEADPPADDRIRVSFEITSEVLSAADITSILGTDPDRSWSIGEPWPWPPDYNPPPELGATSDRVRRFSRWSVFSTLSSRDLEWDHLDDLYTRHAPALENVARLPAEPYRALSIVRYFDGRAFQSHGGGVSAEWVALLGRIGAEIDLDQYVLQDGPDDDWPWPSERARRPRA